MSLAGLIPAGLGVNAVLLICGIALVSGTARGFSGFGSALIFMPLASSIAAPRLAAALLLIIDFVAALPMVRNAWRNADRKATAVMTSVPLGVNTAIAVAAHEIPQEVGDVAILLAAGYSRRKALLLNVVSGASGLVGALLAYGMVAVIPGIRPFVLAFSSASLLYIAMSDLIPDLHRGQLDQNSMRQVLLIAAGVGATIAATVYNMGSQLKTTLWDKIAGAM